MAKKSEEELKAKNLTSSESRIAKEKALQKAKELEKQKVPTAKGELEEVKDFMKESERAKKLLKPAWFLKKKPKKKE